LPLGPQVGAPVSGFPKAISISLRLVADPPVKPQSDRQRFIPLFFDAEAYETVRQRKRDQGFYPSVEIPKGIAVPWKLQSSGESAILTDVINETLDDQNLDKWTYDGFLEYIDGVMTSPDRPSSLTPPKIVAEMQTRVARQHERQQVAVGLALSDALTAQQLNRILGTGI
jgi:hypothetical protein